MYITRHRNWGGSRLENVLCFLVCCHMYVLVSVICPAPWYSTHAYLSAPWHREKINCAAGPPWHEHAYEMSGTLFNFKQSGGFQTYSMVLTTPSESSSQSQCFTDGVTGLFSLSDSQRSEWTSQGQFLCSIEDSQLMLRLTLQSGSAPPCDMVMLDFETETFQFAEWCHI